MKKRFYYFLKALRLRAAFAARNFRRMFVSPGLPEDNPFRVPVIINNRNRLSFLRLLISWLEKNGYTNIHILDNDSSYPPLLEYYKTLPYRVYYLKANLGYKALWKSYVFEKFKSGYYVYTDPDVLPAEECPADVVAKLYAVLEKYPAIEKAGVALRIDDLPEHYALRAEVLQHEEKWWSQQVEKNLYDAPVDTTFALYRPFAWGDAEECKAYRLAGDCTFRHLPWYENSSAPTEEDQFYRSSVKSGSSHWLNTR